MNSLKYVLFAMICIPILLMLWVVGLLLITVVGIPLVIRGCLEAVHTKVYG